MAIFEVTDDLRVEVRENQIFVSRLSQLRDKDGGSILVGLNEVKGLVAALTDAAVSVVDGEPVSDAFLEAKRIVEQASDKTGE